MGLIPQAKCTRCDRRFSGLRTRCPYCGARRHQKGNRVSNTDNSLWKLVIGILLLVVLIAAVVVLLVTTLSDDDAKTTDNDTQNPPISSNEGVNSLDSNEKDNEGDDKDGEDNTGDDNDGQNGNDDNENDDNSPPKIAINSVKIFTAYGSSTTDFTISGISKTETLTAKINPEDADVVPVWESSDSSIVSVVPTDLTGTKATVTAMGRGTATISVIIDGVTYAECVVRVTS